MERDVTVKIINQLVIMADLTSDWDKYVKECPELVVNLTTRLCSGVKHSRVSVVIKFFTLSSSLKQFHIDI